MSTNTVNVVWRPGSSQKAFTISWYPLQAVCDEIKLDWVSLSTGMHNSHTGYLHARFAYRDQDDNTWHYCYPDVTTTIGDMVVPSRCTIQCDVKFRTPIKIRSGFQVSLTLGPLPVTSDGTEDTVTAKQYAEFVYMLRGNYVTNHEFI